MRKIAPHHYKQQLRCRYRPLLCKKWNKLQVLYCVLCFRCLTDHVALRLSKFLLYDAKYYDIWDRLGVVLMCDVRQCDRQTDRQNRRFTDAR